MRVVAHTLPRSGADYVATAPRKLCQKNKNLRTCYIEFAEITEWVGDVLPQVVFTWPSVRSGSGPISSANSVISLCPLSSTASRNCAL
jgi:hypothetical protein